MIAQTHSRISDLAKGFELLTSVPGGGAGRIEYSLDLNHDVIKWQDQIQVNYAKLCPKYVKFCRIVIKCELQNNFMQEWLDDMT